MRNFPKTKEEVFKRLDRHLTKAERLELAQADYLTDYHFDLGAWIRNTWCYKGDVSALFSEEESREEVPSFILSMTADSVSMMVIEEYQKYLRKKYNDK